MSFIIIDVFSVFSDSLDEGVEAEDRVFELPGSPVFAAIVVVRLYVNKGRTDF
jgi:hypothetical protein